MVHFPAMFTIPKAISIHRSSRNSLGLGGRKERRRKRRILTGHGLGRHLLRRGAVQQAWEPGQERSLWFPREGARMQTMVRVDFPNMSIITKLILLRHKSLGFRFHSSMASRSSHRSWSFESHSNWNHEADHSKPRTPAVRVYIMQLAFYIIPGIVE